MRKRLNRSAAPGFGRRARTQSGYTLGELAAVLAMVATVLVVVYMVFGPVYFASRPTRSGPRSTCASNLKQIGLGILMYAQDYDENIVSRYYGPSDDFSDPATGKYQWMDAIYPYLKSEKFLIAPAIPTTRISPI